jgi:hypothetical protein
VIDGVSGGRYWQGKHDLSERPNDLVDPWPMAGYRSPGRDCPRPKLFRLWMHIESQPKAGARGGNVQP